MEVTVRLNGRDHTLTVIRQGDRVRVTRDGVTTEFRLSDVDGPAFTLELTDGTRRRFVQAAGHADGDRRQLWVDGQTFTYERVRDGAPADSGRDASLAASIPSVVAEVLVSPGDTVSAGDKLILLESMKMVIPIQAPRDGIVAAVNCTAGEAVEPGIPLVELTAPETGAPRDE